MELHHTKHHQTYVNGLNAAEESYVKAPSTREKIALQAALKFNGGGNVILRPTLNVNLLTYPFTSRPHKSQPVLEEPCTGESRWRPAQGGQQVESGA
jgi:superoxide dismutase